MEQKSHFYSVSLPYRKANQDSCWKTQVALYYELKFKKWDIAIATSQYFLSDERNHCHCTLFLLISLLNVELI
jgi:hypothetical protein